jgi:hypothetical protein
MSPLFHAINEDIGIIPQIKRIIQAARTGSYAQTAGLLNRLLQALQKELSKGHLSVKDIGKVTYSLETLAEMQNMENWVAFADVLEYEFLPLWQKITENKMTTEENKGD